MNWFALWLFLHIAAAIVAFGPTFVFPVVGPAIARNPSHAVFGFEIFELIEVRLVVPFALTMPLSGIGLIRTANIDFFATHWLLSATVLYVIALALALLHQVPVTKRILTVLEGAPAGAPPGPPPAELMQLLTRTRIVGMVLTLLLAAIVILMVYGREAGLG